MNKFQAHQLAAFVGILEHLETNGNVVSRLLEKEPFKQHMSSDEVRASLDGDIARSKIALSRGKELCANIGLTATIQQIDMVSYYLTPQLTSAEFAVHMNRVKETLCEEMKQFQYLWVAADRSALLEGERLFGDVPYDEFPSARGDIKEAGNCLAAECTTAAVFHLMRAAEFSLRAIARDRNLSFAKKGLEQQEWGTILQTLDSLITKMRLDDGAKWKKPEYKEAQVCFYNEAVQELRSFNEAWRKHVSHADAMAFTDRDQAISVFNHVRNFMVKLAPRVSEVKAMPEYWESM